MPHYVKLNLRKYRRRQGARRIQRAFRRYRRRPRKIAQRYNSVKNVTYSKLGSRGGRKTLSKRVKALEASSSGHHDEASLTAEIISWNGTTLLNSQNSYNEMLHVQGAKADGDFDPGDKEKENERRSSDEIYGKSVRIRGLIKGIRPKDDLAPTDLSTMNPATAQLMREMCKTRVWIHLLQDMRPSKMSATGEAQVNALPLATVGDTAICEPFANSPPGFLTSQLKFFGAECALRSYAQSRFKLLSSQCITTTFENPEKFFDISYKINRKLKYVPARQGTPSPANPASQPYNYGLYVFLTCVVPTAVPAWSTLALQSPTLTRKTSRFYYTDTS